MDAKERRDAATQRSYRKYDAAGTCQRYTVSRRKDGMFDIWHNEHVVSIMRADTCDQALTKFLGDK